MSWKFDYWYLENFLNAREVKSIGSFIEKNNEGLEKNSMGAYDGNIKSKKKTTTYVISWHQLKSKLDKLEDTINFYNERSFGYILYPFTQFNHSLLNVYDSNSAGEYDWHFDTSRSDIIDTKLTVIINLSTGKYKGGDFFIFNGNSYKVKQLDTPGNMVIFKSYLNHKVTRVTEGTRKSLTLFCSGPKFK